VQMPNLKAARLYLAHLGVDIPIIFMTSYPDDAIKQRALNAGAIGFLDKRFDLAGNHLVSCLEVALKRSAPAV
jgi:FixJ family two-component response regulator